MPLNFITGSPYPVDYPKLLDDSSKSSPDEALWTAEWLKLFSELDAELIEYLQDSQNIEKINSDIRNLDIEYYQFLFPIYSQQFLWQMNITRLLKYVSNSSLKPRKVASIEFLRTDSIYHWNKTEDTVIKKSNIGKPILVLPLPDGSNLVIDGNHRITKTYKSNSKILVLDISQEALMRDASLFPTQIDHWLFLYYIEKIRIITDILNGKKFAFPSINIDWFKRKGSTFINT